MAEYISFSNTHEIFIKSDHILVHKASLRKFQTNQQYRIFSDPLQLSKKSNFKVNLRPRKFENE